MTGKREQEIDSEFRLSTSYLLFNRFSIRISPR